MRTSWLDPLVTEVDSPGLLSRTGIALARDDRYRGAAEDAARSGMDSVDYVSWKLDSLDPRQRFITVTTTSLLDDLDRLCSNTWFSSCLVVTNIDVALARLSASDLASFWQFLFESFKRRPVGLIIAISQSAAGMLLPAGERGRWLETQRLVEQGREYDG